METGPLPLADGLLSLLSFALAAACLVPLSAVLAVTRVFGGGLPPAVALLSLGTLALCALGGVIAGLLLMRHSGGRQHRAALSLAALLCYLLPGAALLFLGVPSYPALARIFPLCCLVLALACLAKVGLERFANRRSEILSPVDPGFYEQLAALAKETGRIFVAVVAILILSALLLAYFLLN